MAKSVRISDELYTLVEKTGAELSRSLAQQLEHWARIGAAVDAAGLTTDQVLQLMGRSNPLTEQVLAMLLIKEHKHRGAAEIVARHAKDEAAVRTGRKSAKSLFVFPESMVKEAKLSRVTPKKKGTGW
jgi:hypothetical protein